MIFKIIHAVRETFLKWTVFTSMILVAFMHSNLVYAQCDPANPLGCVTNPLPADKGGGAGLIFLLNNILRLVFVVAGIYAFVRVVLAGFSFINAGGDTKKIQVAWDSIWQSLLGVAIVIGSIAIAALMGLLLFGDATAILNPKVYGPIP